MAFAKRIFLFIIVNILVLFTISLTLNLLGITGYASQYGIDYNQLLAFAAVVGFAGSFISLFLSKFMAKFMMGVKIIDPAQSSGAERDLVMRIHRLAQKANLPKMPEVGIYDSPEVNAFATGPSKKNSLVAVSTGLLHQMDENAVEGVLAHEVSHISNGDMVTMTLIQGVVNTFVIFFARIAAWGVSQAMTSDRDRDQGPSPWVHFLCIHLFEFLFSLFGAIVTAYFSRRREFRADAGSARLAGKEKMIRALEALKGHHELDTAHPSVASLKINGTVGSFFALFATHPPLDARIAALRSGVIG